MALDTSQLAGTLVKATACYFGELSSVVIAQSSGSSFSAIAQSPGDCELGFSGDMRDDALCAFVRLIGATKEPYSLGLQEVTLRLASRCPGLGTVSTTLKFARRPPTCEEILVYGRLVGPLFHNLMLLPLASCRFCFDEFVVKVQELECI